MHYSSCITTLYRNKVSRDDAGIWDVSVRVRFEECDRLRGDDHFTFTICYLKCYNILQYPYDIDRVSCWHITTYIIASYRYQIVIYSCSTYSYTIYQFVHMFIVRPLYITWTRAVFAQFAMTKKHKMTLTLFAVVLWFIFCRLIMTFNR